MAAEPEAPKPSMVQKLRQGTQSQGACGGGRGQAEPALRPQGALWGHGATTPPRDTRSRNTHGAALAHTQQCFWDCTFSVCQDTLPALGTGSHGAPMGPGDVTALPKPSINGRS